MHELMRGQQLERVDLEQHGVEEQLPGRGPLLGVLVQTPTDEILLLLVLQEVDGLLHCLVGDGAAGAGLLLAARLVVPAAVAARARLGLGSSLRGGGGGSS